VLKRSIIVIFPEATAEMYCAQLFEPKNVGLHTTVEHPKLDTGGLQRLNDANPNALIIYWNGINHFEGARIT
jgi:hypothetical protein